ncbi:MAG: ABC transporter ATP-binding protein [Deinococcales bacterium]|jgi:ABC-2 type transport system ATP-binding protein
MHAIQFSSVVKQYGAVRAVNTFDLTIGSGQSVALLGPNGAGKSTTISMLLGLATPDAGSIEVFGHTSQEAVKEGLIGAMLQEGDLVPGIKVRELIDFVRRLYPNPLELDEILRLADLTELVDRRTDKLSGGQAQRVRFALAIAGQPHLLVLDEPTAAMDVASRHAFWASMRAYAAQGHTILFATHYLEEADDNADRIVVIDHGQVIADGTGAQIKATTGTRAVRFTLGSQPAAGLQELAGVTSVEIRDDVALLRTDDPDATLHALYASGLRIRDLETDGANLEEAFLSLTGDAA